jgi:hypothetical protein
MISGNAEFFPWQGASFFLKGGLDSSVLPPSKKKASNAAQGNKAVFL